MSINVTYNELLKLLPSYMERKDKAFLDQIPNFINLAENRVATDMKQEGFQAVVNGVTGLDNVVPKPVFWRESLSFSLKIGGRWKQLRMRSLEYLKVYWPDVSEVGEPAYYADYNINNFYVAPTPGTVYEFELVYYARLEPLTPEHQENWMTLNAPQALLFACLLEASLWARDAGAEQKWMQQYQIATGGLIVEDKTRKADRNSQFK